VYRHRLGDPQSKDELLYTEPDDGFFLGVSLTDTGNWIVIDASDHDTSEARLVSASGDAGAQPVLVQERQVGVKYDVSDFEDQLIILTNEGGATDFKVAIPTSHCHHRHRHFHKHVLSRTVFLENGRLFSPSCFPYENCSWDECLSIFLAYFPLRARAVQNHSTRLLEFAGCDCPDIIPRKGKLARSGPPPARRFDSWRADRQGPLDPLGEGMSLTCIESNRIARIFVVFYGIHQLYRS